LTAWVVDASVAVKWFIPEIHSEVAKRLLIEGNELVAPELLLPEVGNILWKKYRIGELEAVEAREILADLRRLPLHLVRMAPYIENALALAVQHGRTVYDCIYLALAIHRGGRFVTADRKLINALQDTKVAANIVRIDDILRF
jgi:predicted nucleic acid-binding protein